MRGGGITVVKLGGSYARSKYLAPWLDTLSRCGGRAVIVAGGGPFADAVRATQPVMHFDDRVAHHMALLAMEQYALALASLRSSFALAASIAALRRALREERVPPGQSRTKKWPVLDAHGAPDVDLTRWEFSAGGFVGKPLKLNLNGLNQQVAALSGSGSVLGVWLGWKVAQRFR